MSVFRDFFYLDQPTCWNAVLPPRIFTGKVPKDLVAQPNGICQFLMDFSVVIDWANLLSCNLPLLSSEEVLCLLFLAFMEIGGNQPPPRREEPKQVQREVHVGRSNHHSSPAIRWPS